MRQQVGAWAGQKEWVGEVLLVVLKRAAEELLGVLKWVAEGWVAAVDLC